jgi:hypothetical protein
LKPGQDDDDEDDEDANPSTDDDGMFILLFPYCPLYLPSFLYSLSLSLHCSCQAYFVAQK